MPKSRSNYTSLVSGSDKTEKKTQKSKSEAKDITKKARGDCDVSESTSHTQFFRQASHEVRYERITTDEYFGKSESMSLSTDTFQCIHGPQRKNYTEKELLKRNLEKGLDRVPNESRWTNRCKPAYGWEMAETLEFLVMDPTVEFQQERLIMHLKDFVKISIEGYKIDHLTSVCTIVDYLIETLPRNPKLKEPTLHILQNMMKPVVLNAASDIMKFFDSLTHYMGFLCYLLMRIEDDQMFDIVSKAVIWNLSAPDNIRGNGAATLRHTLMAAAPMMYQTVSRMLAVATSHRFPTYLSIGLLLACNNANNCLELMQENILENLFYRFNPYFPDRELPSYDINPADPQDINVKLGDSSVNMQTTLSLLLVLLEATKQHLVLNPKYAILLPCPDPYAQRCFIWAYRYECRAREHLHQRNALTAIAMALLHCFGSRLENFSGILMPDILTLAVKTEVPPRDDWTGKVNFNISQQDVQFKKLLIYFSVDMLKTFSHNQFMVQSSHWLLGLMYLLDPGLCYLRARWSPSLFAELRKTALQALVCTIPLMPHNLVKEYSLIRRIMWYIEWYSESPYELPILYWCVRLLQITIFNRKDPIRKDSLKDMFDTHGVIILVHLCNTLLDQKTPPVAKAQVVISLCLRMLTSAVESDTKVVCCVYPNIKWPSAVTAFARKMLDVVLYSFDKHLIINDRWLIALLNFIWEAIIWKPENRKKFIAKDGIFKLLDIISMTKPPVQCIALALVCDATKAGDAVGQLVTWRANLGASSVFPNVVKRGATIATLLASIFRDECRITGVRLDSNGVIEDLDAPIMSSNMREVINSPSFSEAKSQRTPVCLAAGELAGSRMSKAFALLQMLSEDLDYKVSLADETYKLYKNIRLEPEDETALVLCAHYLTLKLAEVWMETKAQSPGLLPHDEEILEEFLHIGRGWSREIKRQQNEVIQLNRKKESEEENSLYEFLGRVRLNIALDALREVRCVARSADRARITHALLQDAVRAHHRRSIFVNTRHAHVIKTYKTALDDQNMTGQNVKVHSIYPKTKPKPLDLSGTSSS